MGTVCKTKLYSVAEPDILSKLSDSYLILKIHLGFDLLGCGFSGLNRVRCVSVKYGTVFYALVG
jgi:hypothetical protein